MKKQMIIAIMTKDRPGVISAVTGTINEMNGDIADLNQTVVCGYLTMILGVSFPQKISCELLEKELNLAASQTGFTFLLKELKDEELQRSTLPNESYILTLHGPNRSGIVFAVSSICQKYNVNILGLSTNLDNNNYTMALQLDITKATSPLHELRKAFATFAHDADLTIMMQHNDIFKATNEVTLQ